MASTLISKIINSIFVTALLLNSYKIFLMPFQPYNIFPWSPEVNHAKSNPASLIYHTITAFGLLFVARTWALAPKKPSEDKRLTPEYAAAEKREKHVTWWLIFFTLAVVLNITHLGSKPWYIALLVNGGGLSGLFYALAESRPHLFFFVLNTPVYMEVVKLGLYLQQYNIGESLSY